MIGSCRYEIVYEVMQNSLRVKSGAAEELNTLKKVKCGSSVFLPEISFDVRQVTRSTC